MATIQKRNKSYRIRVSNGYDSNGKQIIEQMTFTPPPGMTAKQTEKEVKRQAVLFEERVRSGQYIESDIKLSDFAERWFVDYAEKQLKIQTVVRYRDLMKRINAAIGHIRIDRIQPTHLLKFYNNLAEDGIRDDLLYVANNDLREIIKKQNTTQKKVAETAGIGINTLAAACSGKNILQSTATKISAALHRKPDTLFKIAENSRTQLSGKTIRHYHALISSILSTAVQWQIIPLNPCDRVKPPRVANKEAEYLDDVETARLLELLVKEPIPFQTSIALFLYTGLRRGELCGLEWEDVDFNNYTLNIQRTSLYTPSKGVYTDSTKNTSSERVIKLPEAAIHMLRSYKVWQNKERLSLGDQWQDNDRLFTDWNGAPVNPHSIYAKFKAFLDYNNLPDVSLKSLRHTNASLMIANGVALTTVSKRLGHANTNTTTKVYLHAIKSADEAAADIIQDVLLPKRSKLKAGQDE
ncbi:MAG: tyrosine-type recombinase/integrase [Christensenellaceae bacterium]|jgi:integrase